MRSESSPPKCLQTRDVFILNEKTTIFLMDSLLSPLPKKYLDTALQELIQKIQICFSYVVFERPEFFDRKKKHQGVWNAWHFS